MGKDPKVVKQRRVTIWLAMTLGGLAALAIGCASRGPATATPTALIPARSGPAGPALAVDKLQVDLGTVRRTQQGVQTFLVLNQGQKPLRVGPATVDAPQGVDATLVNQGTLEVAPGEGTLLRIKLGTHRELGPHQLQVNVPSNDPARPSTTLSLRFTVVEDQAPTASGPRLQVDKETIDIGPVPNDWPLYEQFTLRNSGNTPLIIQGSPPVRVEKGC